MSNNTSHDDAASQVHSMSDEELKEFRKLYETNLLPAITQILSAANIGGQVSLQRRKSIVIVTREEMRSDIKQEIERTVSAELGGDLSTKISVEFHAGEIERTSR
ncbi:hypothetical protein ONZ43_g3733 [Nemania bipapillata]|uniref:Uncharacterized protein n=1 Tax=Nemania bipapillata TaxID=110536 RepID=A0ACC2IVU0_9PEZI|nr:hypothetical protein ONZ43_g3733 [Nemania bipapillata]